MPLRPENIVKTETCWIWTGYVGRTGYGQARLNGRVEYTHRIAWTEAHGPVPSGLYVCHSCDVRNCVNPAHLFLGSHADNMADAAMKGRIRGPVGHHRTRGVRNGQAKLTDDDIRMIREQVADGARHRDVANAFGVSREAIGLIARGQRWAHVTRQSHIKYSDLW